MQLFIKALKKDGWKSSYLVMRMKRFPNEICYPKMEHHISLIYNYLDFQNGRFSSQRFFF